MPRKLSSYGDKVRAINLGNNNDSPSRHRRTIALLAMNVIAEYSILDSFFRSIFISMLGDNPQQAAAIYASINSDAAKRDAFRAVAKTYISPEEMEILDALFWLQGPCAKERNKLAHWTWGHANELPDAVLLVDPESHSQNQISNAEAWRRYQRLTLSKLLMQQKGDDPPPEPSRDGIYVYEEKDFTAASDKIQRLIQLVVQFRWLLNRGDPGYLDGSILAQLQSEPEVAEFLVRLRKNREFNSEAMQAQPGESERKKTILEK